MLNLPIGIRDVLIMSMVMICKCAKLLSQNMNAVSVVVTGKCMIVFISGNVMALTHLTIIERNG